MTGPVPGDTVAVVGYGLHGQAVAAALMKRSIDAVVIDDAPSPAAAAHATELGLEMAVGPEPEELKAILQRCSAAVPTPGLPETHLFFSVASEIALSVTSEFDLAAAWDARPTVAITGTNGKTTVTTMVTRMLNAAGHKAVMAGNMDLPLVTAIDDPEPQMFVVEASSFRLGHSRVYAPAVGTWLNLEPDHLDVHLDMAGYEAAKARIWTTQPDDGVAIGNAVDPAVVRNMPGRPSDLTFGEGGDAHVRDGRIIIGDADICAVADLARSLPHDIANALAAGATALAAGATVASVAEVLRDFSGLEHRVEFVAEIDEVRWFNDSKATTPHAVLAGVGGFDSVVLVAGGRNKGVDLGSMAEMVPPVRAVVAIGEAAAEVAAVFDGVTPVETAGSMSEAVAAARSLARPGDAVVLSPACTSYDWYENYAARGDDFARLVRELIPSIGTAL